MKIGHSQISPVVVVVVVLLAGISLGACAPGDERFIADAPAGFLWGIWHGAISIITLIVGIWSESVQVYELDNTGGWYDFGFLIGVTCVWGGCGRGGERTWRQSRARQREEWEEVWTKVEAKLKRNLRSWAEAEPDEAWDDVEKKVEAKVAEIVREWAESD